MLLAFNDITEEQRIQRNVVAIMRHSRYRWITGLLMVGEMTVADDVETARTNGRDTEFGREFVRSLTDAELRFVILHELYHKMYKHLITWKWMWDKYGMLANVACDYNINGKLVDENREDGFAKMPVYKDGEHEGESGSAMGTIGWILPQSSGCCWKIVITTLPLITEATDLHPGRSKVMVLVVTTYQTYPKASTSMIGKVPKRCPKKSRNSWLRM